ncbi:NAD(P)-binding protein [Penicillium riverlandense]|uniref:NAD(P)-binding protein n=1 Tax=Penicillium riverlandense TaxID=1903569 RepID=UPI002547D8D6|nr:NAD(P)-binding protein [Penicillium riverlandense]KAJ5808507.1 NAD(P)-binding protein [Penicillium riverlandense]
MDSQRILVLGATGGSGLAFVEQALSLPNPPHLTLYVRTPSKLPSEFQSQPGISIVVGGLSDFETLDSVMKSQSITTVVSFLGAYFSASAIIFRPKETPIADSFPTIIRAMKANNVSRLIVLSTASFWITGKDISTWGLSIFGVMPKIFVPQGDAEMVRIAEVVSRDAAEQDWTIFRVPHLTDGPSDLPVWAGYAGPGHRGGLNLSRRSLAMWVLNEISEPKWIRQAPFLGNY